MKLLLGLAVATFTRVALAVPLQRPFSYHLLAPQPDTQMMLWDGEVWNTAPDCNLTPGNAPAGTTCIATMTLTETIDPQDEDAGWMYYMMIMSKPDEGGSPVRVLRGGIVSPNPAEDEGWVLVDYDTFSSYTNGVDLTTEYW